MLLPSWRYVKIRVVFMFKNRFFAFLKVLPEERRMVFLTAALFLCLQAGQGLGENAASALFLSSFDVKKLLPYLYMGLGGWGFVAIMAYSAALSRFQNSSVVVNLLAGSALLFGVEWLAILWFGSSFYSLLWLTTRCAGVVLGALLWTVAGEVCDARQAKRLFPLFASVGILGSIVGNLLAGAAASLLGKESPVFLYALFLGGGFWLARRIAEAYFRVETEAAKSFNPFNDMKAGYEFTRTSPLFGLIALSSILGSVLFFSVEFPFNERLASAFPNDAEGLAIFQGVLNSATTAATFLVSLLLANRFYLRFGIVNGVLLMPLAYLLAYALFFVFFDLRGAIGARMLQLVTLNGLVSTAWNALFNVVPLERRGQVLAFNTGVSQSGMVLSGILILLSGIVLSDVRIVLLLGAVTALLVIRPMLKMRAAYSDALLSALRAGRTEVFSDEEEAFSGFKNDPDALQTILKALRDARVNTRRLATEMLAKMENPLAIPGLVERLSDEDAGVRAAAIRALSDLKARSAFGKIVLGLDDPSDEVREATLASLPRLGVDSSPELIRVLERLLKERNLRICAQAAVVLIHLGAEKKARLVLVRLMKDEDVNHRRLALEAYERILSNADDLRKVDEGLVLKALNDPSPVVRRGAVRVATRLLNEVGPTSLVKCLFDEDSGVRRLAAEALKQTWTETRSMVLRLLAEERDGKVLSSLLDSIPPGDAETFDILQSYIRWEVTQIRYLRSLLSVLPAAGRISVLLRETLQHRETLGEGRLIKAVGLFGNPRAMELVRKGLNAGSSERAAALEALEMLGDKEITLEVLPILDRAGVFQEDGIQPIHLSDALSALLTDEDGWLRALAARVVAEIGLRDFIPALKKLRRDPLPLVREAARDALTRMDGKPMKTLKTLSTLDRVLLLREVPIFSRLSPEDLERIAGVAQEQLFPPHSVICREGEPGDSLFIIAAGRVEVVKQTKRGEKVLAVRQVGEFVGEMAILESSMRSATLRAVDEVRVLTIDGDAFKSILMDRPEVAIAVLKSMSSRVRDLNERVRTWV